MNQNLFKRSRFKLLQSNDVKIKIVKSKGFLWTVPIYASVFYAFYAGTEWSDNYILMIIQIVFISVIPILVFLGLLNILVYKLEINEFDITKREVAFPFKIKTYRWTNNQIQAILIEKSLYKDKKRKNYSITLNLGYCNSDLIIFNEQKDGMNTDKLKQIGEEIADIIDKPLHDNMGKTTEPNKK